MVSAEDDLLPVGEGDGCFSRGGFFELVNRKRLRVFFAEPDELVRDARLEAVQASACCCSMG